MISLSTLRILYWFLTCILFFSLSSIAAYAEGKNFISSAQGILFSLGGELEVEAIDSTNDANLITNTDTTTNDDNSVSRFSVDRLMLKPKITLPSKKVYIEGELEFFGTSTGTLLKEAYAVIDLSKNIFLKIGLDDRFIMNPEDRGTEIYPINGTAFWRDEDIGFTFGGEHPAEDEKGLWSWRASITNGLALREQAVGKNDVYFIIHDQRQTNDITDNTKEYGLGLGYTSLKSKAKWGFFAFGFWSHLREGVSLINTATDVDFLQEVIPAYTSTNRQNWFVGSNFSFTRKRLSLFSQYIFSKDGEVKRNGFYIQPTFSFKSFDFLYRYNFLDVNTKDLTDNTANSSFTWDRQTHSLAVNIPFSKGVLWRNEYHFNLEETGSSIKRVDNNEALSQLEIRF
jgi:hypothetical protein